MNFIQEVLLFFVFHFSMAISKDNEIVKEKHLLDDNLKVLRKDFNKLVENVEDFVGDFVVQIQQASKLAATAYINDEDYNWQDFKSTTPTTKIIKTTTQPKSLPDPYVEALLPAEDGLLSNEIDTRKKRSAQELDPTISVNDQTHTIGRKILSPARPSFVRPDVEMLGSQQSSKLKDGSSIDEGKICKSEKDSNLEQQKFEELKLEVRKLGDLVQLLKDQQLLMKTVAPKETEDDIEGNLENKSFFEDGLRQLEKHKEIPAPHSETIKLDGILANLKKNEENLIKTAESLKKEKEKEELLEQELKRQSGELKFIKVMVEHLYDSKQKSALNDKRSSIEDIDSVLGATHIPKPYPIKTHPLFNTREPGESNGEAGKTKFLRSLIPRESQTLFPSLDNQTTSTKDNDNSTKVSIEEVFEEAHKILESAPLTYWKYYENELLNILTVNALLQLTKKDPERFKMFDLENKTGMNNQNLNDLFSRSTGLSQNRANAKSRRSDDLDFKLKLIDLLANSEGKTTDSLSSNDKQMGELLKSLLKPEKKSEDEVALETLKALVGNKQKQKTQDSLTSLLQSLSSKPQSKIDDSADIEGELKQLQKAINQLRPKDDVDVSGFDLGNKFGKDGTNQDFQSLLSQMISQNPAVPAINAVAQPSIAGLDINPNPLILNHKRPELQGYPYVGGYNPNLYNFYPGGADLYHANLYKYQPSPIYQYGLYPNNPVSYESSPGFNINPNPYTPLTYSSSYPQKPYYQSAGEYFDGKQPQASTSPNYGTQFFQLQGPNPEYNYGAKGVARPSLGQPYGPVQAPEAYKYGVITDLTGQIQNLENIITGLKSGDYSQSYEDTAAIATLEQRIYDLKGVINSLNSPHITHGPPSSGAYQQSPDRPHYPSYNPAPPPRTTFTYTNKAAPHQILPTPGYNPPQLPPSPLESAPQPSYEASYQQPPPAPIQAPSSSPYQEVPKAVDSRAISPSYQPKESSARQKRQIESNLETSKDEEVNDHLNQIASIFKKYLGGMEEAKQNPIRPPDLERSVTLDNLQETLHNLKLQLESEKQSGRSLNDLLPPVSSYYPFNGQLNQLYSNKDYHHQMQPLDNKGKHNDVFTEILVKILEKVFDSLPEVLKRVTGNLLSDIGGSYGDYDSPLQNVLRNLGSFGQLPLILVKILESLGSIFKYLKKNRLFREFLLPAIILGVMGGAVLFLIYFLQQDEEPYGYIGYNKQEGENSYGGYPKYQAAASHSANNNPYRSTNINPMLDSRNYRFQNDVNSNFYYNYKPSEEYQLDRGKDGPLRFSRGYLL